MAGVQVGKNGKEGLLRLAQRTTRSFVLNVSASSDNQWKMSDIDGVEDCRAMSNTITLCPEGVNTVAFSSSFWIPVPPKKVFDFVSHKDSRNQWDILNRGYVIQAYALFTTGEKPKNRVSVVGAESLQKNEIMYLQESYNDELGLYFVYAPMDLPAMSIVASGGNLNCMNILASGFMIHPDKPTMNGQQPNGCVLTMAFHVACDLPGKKCPKPSQVPKTVYQILEQTGIIITQAVLSGEV